MTLIAAIEKYFSLSLIFSALGALSRTVQTSTDDCASAFVHPVASKHRPSVLHVHAMCTSTLVCLYSKPAQTICPMCVQCQSSNLTPSDPVLE